MAIDAVFPAASELVMVYAGALASGAFASQDVVLFGHQLEPGGWACGSTTMAFDGTLMNRPSDPAASARRRVAGILYTGVYAPPPALSSSRRTVTGSPSASSSRSRWSRRRP